MTRIMLGAFMACLLGACSVNTRTVETRPTPATVVTTTPATTTYSTTTPATTTYSTTTPAGTTSTTVVR